MDSSLKAQIVTKVSNAQKVENFKVNNVRNMIEYIESNVTCLGNMCASVKRNIEQAKQAAGKNEKLAEAEYMEAKLRMSLEEYSQAIEAINKALVDCPPSSIELLAKIYHLRALILYKSGHNNTALWCIRKAQQLAPKAKHLLYEAKFLFKLEQYNRSAQCLQQALNLSKNGDGLGGAKLEAYHQKIADELQEALAKVNTNTSETDGESEACSTDVEDDDEVYCKFNKDYRLEIAKCDKLGRYFIANEAIPAGTLIFKERSYSTIIFEDSQKKKCSFCLKPAEFICLPCDHCNELVYCSQECQTKDWRLVHRFECGLAGWLADKSKSSYHVYRLFNRIGVDTMLQLDSIEETFKDYTIDDYLGDEEQKRGKGSAIDHGEEKLRLQELKVFASLESHAEDFGLEYLSYHLTNAIEIAAMVMLANGKLADIFEREQLLSLIELAFVFTRRILINSFRWSEHTPGQKEKAHVGTCLCLLGSLFNHSCDYNAEWMFDGGNLYVSTVKNIQPGDQVNICYGADGRMPYEDRQKNHACYYFACRCSLCLQDVTTAWPILQCRQCPGPVLSNAAVFDASKGDEKEASCLFCHQPYPGTARALEALTIAHFELDGMTKLFEVVDEEEKDKFLVQIGQQFNTVKGLIYRKSMVLKEDIFKVAKAFSKAPDKQIWAEDIDQLDELVDQLTGSTEVDNNSKEKSPPKDIELCQWSEQLASIEERLKTFKLEV